MFSVRVARSQQRSHPCPVSLYLWPPSRPWPPRSRPVCQRLQSLCLSARGRSPGGWTGTAARALRHAHCAAGVPPRTHRPLRAVRCHGRPLLALNSLTWRLGWLPQSLRPADGRSGGQARRHAGSLTALCDSQGSCDRRSRPPPHVAATGAFSATFSRSRCVFRLTEAQKTAMVICAACFGTFLRAGWLALLRSSVVARLSNVVLRASVVWSSVAAVLCWFTRPESG